MKFGSVPILIGAVVCGIAYGYPSYTVKDVPVNCVWCEMIAYLAQEGFVKMATSETELETKLLGACLKITSATMCKKYMPGLAEVLWKYGKRETPKQLCTLILLCPNATTEQQLYDNELMMKPTQDLPKLIGNNSRSCEFCHDLLKFVKNAAGEYEGKIVDLVIQYFCDALPDLSRKECTAAIKEDIPKVIDGLNIDILCNMTVFC